MGEKKKPRSFLMSKWIKTKVLLGNKAVSPFIPDTRQFGESALKSMLEKYSMVYVKPDVGTHGIGVIRAERLNHGKYIYQVDTRTKTFGDFGSFYGSIRKIAAKKRYLIQKGIHLMKYDKRRFDVRVMVQLSPKGKWETTGLIGRIAHPEKVVTNYHNGGKLMDTQRLLSASLKPDAIRKVTGQLENLGVTCARQLHKKYPGFRQIGLDVGFDASWKPWIIEVNTNPDPYIFSKLADKAAYRKVMRYRKAAAYSQ